MNDEWESPAVVYAQHCVSILGWKRRVGIIGRVLNKMSRGKLYPKPHIPIKTATALPVIKSRQQYEGGPVHIVHPTPNKWMN